MYDRRSVSVIKIQAARSGKRRQCCPSTFSAKQFSRKIQMLGRWKIKVKKLVFLRPDTWCATGRTHHQSECNNDGLP